MPCLPRLTRVRAGFPSTILWRSVPTCSLSAAEDIGELESSGASGYEEFESVGLAGLTESLQDAVDLLDVSTTFLIAFETGKCDAAETLMHVRELSISHGIACLHGL